MPSRKFRRKPIGEAGSHPLREMPKKGEGQTDHGHEPSPTFKQVWVDEILLDAEEAAKVARVTFGTTVHNGRGTSRRIAHDTRFECEVLLTPEAASELVKDLSAWLKDAGGSESHDQRLAKSPGGKK